MIILIIINFIQWLHSSNFDTVNLYSFLPILLPRPTSVLFSSLSIHTHMYKYTYPTLTTDLVQKGCGRLS